MKERDYLWCVLNMLLDEEEELDRLCPTCRAEAESGRCSVCGMPRADMNAAYNENFDLAWFEQMKGGGA